MRGFEAYIISATVYIIRAIHPRFQLPAVWRHETLSRAIQGHF